MHEPTSHQPQSKPPRAAAPRLEDFPIRVPDIVRFADMDRQGHVNNSVYSTYLETGRVGVIYDADQGLQVTGATTVLARVEIDFLKELRWPGTVEIGTAVAEIGRSSYTFAQAIFSDDACVVLGLAEFDHANIIFDFALDAAEGRKLLFKRGALLHQPAGALGVIPQIGVFGQVIQFGEAGVRLVEVKDASSAAQGTA